MTRPHPSGLEPGASQDAISAAFRATILRCHPDLHLGAAWAVAKTQRVLKAVEELRGPRSGQSPSAAWRRSAGGRGGGDASGPFQSRGPNISFYPNTAFDFWSAYGDREPTPEEAKRFEQDWELAKKSAAERLRKLEAARTSAVTPDGELRTMPLAAGALAVALIMAQARSEYPCAHWSPLASYTHTVRRIPQLSPAEHELKCSILTQVMFVGNSDANNGAPKGAAASGDCRSRGGGFCRFM